MMSEMLRGPGSQQGQVALFPQAPDVTLCEELVSSSQGLLKNWPWRNLQEHI